MERITRGLILVYPDFEFVKSEELSYLNPLISGLKTAPATTQSLPGKAANASSKNPDLHDKSTMLEHFKEQIRQEEQLMVEVPSIFNTKESQKFENFKVFLMKKFKDRITKNFSKCLHKLNESESNSKEHVEKCVN